MQIAKDEIIDLLRSRGEHDKASNLDCALPRYVDPDQDAGLLHQFDLSVRELTES